MLGIALGDDGDLKVGVGSDGLRHLLVEETTRQNQLMLLYANKGEIKEAPTKGIGIDRMVLDNSFEEIRKSVIEEMEREGMRVKKCKATVEGIYLDAEYK